MRRNALVPLIVLGVGLALAPVAFQMFSRAPKGAVMLDDFKPFMTERRLGRFESYMPEIDAAVRETDTKLQPYLAEHAGIDRGQFDTRFATFTTFTRQWPAIDKDMSNTVSPMAKQVCSKQDVQKTATGFVADSVCTVAGVSMTSHSEIVGAFNSGYTVKTTAHIQRGDKPVDTVTTIEAKWLGACKADQKPGDIVMPGGFKLNVKDAEKLKGLLPR